MSPSHIIEGMDYYPYDGCDSNLPSSDPPPGSYSEASSAQPELSLVIMLDDDDDIHPLPSHRPKLPLPRNFSRGYHPPVKEETVQGVEVPRPEVYHTINCAPELRDKSLEELRVECYGQSQVATREPPKPVSDGMREIPPSFLPWRESKGNFVAGQVEPSIQDVCMDD